MVLAAGKGTRLRPRTDTTPKPLVKVAGKALIDYSFDILRAGDVRDVVVNKYHLADQIETHVQQVKDLKVELSDETNQLLETGGGVAKALTLLGQEPFFVLNSDVIVLDAGKNSLHRMQDMWDPEVMDALLLLHPVSTAVGYEGQGDFFLQECGRLARRQPDNPAPYMFTGVQLLHPRLFEGCPSGPFSLNVIYDKALAQGRLFGLHHEGKWLHVGTEEALEAATNIIEEM
jgi:MurNAc alpha-1-phosphate uridylyltransferase